MEQAAPFAALRVGEFRSLLVASALEALASRALAVVIGYQVYALTRDPLALGWLGLVEAIPAVSLSLLAGHLADRHDRRTILLAAQGVLTLCAALFALISLDAGPERLPALYAVVFLAGLGRGFAEPTLVAFEAQVVPRAVYVNAATWLASGWQASSIVGPALGGLAYDLLGVAPTYLLIALFLALSCGCILRIASKPLPPPAVGESILASIAGGVRYVFGNQVLVGSMALDLFAVLFGGTVALLPIFASDILQVGARGLGLLNAAPAVGALAMMLWSTRHPPSRRAGRVLLVAVAGFGLSIVVFALSRDFTLSLLALAASGACDGLSMVVRRSITRLLAPEHLRARIASVSMVFIGSSNELGAFESGVAARLLGTVTAVWLGGLVTVLVVAVTALAAPKLRRLDLEQRAAGEA